MTNTAESLISTHIDQRLPLSLEQRVNNLASLVQIMELQTTEDQVHQVVQKYPQHLQPFLLDENKLLAHDQDHTNVHNGAPLKLEDLAAPIHIQNLLSKESPFIHDGKITLKSGEFHAEDLEQEERDNLDMLIGLYLKGVPVSIITGREVALYPYAQYMYQRTMEFVQTTNELARYQGIQSPFVELPYAVETADGEIVHKTRLATSEGKPIMFTTTTGNGGQSMDVFGDFEVFDQRPIPGDFYLQMYDPEVDQLLRDSTTEKRKYQLAIVEQSRWKDNGPESVRQEIEALRDPQSGKLDPQAVGKIEWLFSDYMNIGPSGTKNNLVLDSERIVHDQTLNLRWLNLTGVKIVDKASYYQAMDALLARQFGTTDKSQWPVETTPAFSKGQACIDFTAKDVNKGTTVPVVADYITKVYEQFNFPVRKLTPVTNGDGPHANDRTMLVGFPGGVSVSTEHDIANRPQQDGYPVYLDEVYNLPSDATSIHLTREWLIDLHIIHSKIRLDPSLHSS